MVTHLRQLPALADRTRRRSNPATQPSARLPGLGSVQRHRNRSGLSELRSVVAPNRTSPRFWLRSPIPNRSCCRGASGLRFRRRSIETAAASLVLGLVPGRSQTGCLRFEPPWTDSRCFGIPDAGRRPRDKTQDQRRGSHHLQYRQTSAPPHRTLTSHPPPWISHSNSVTIP